MATVNPAYTIPVVNDRELWECGVALGKHREAAEAAALPDARPGFAYADPHDPYSHLRMRLAHEADPDQPLPEGRPVNPAALGIMAQLGQSRGPGQVGQRASIELQGTPPRQGSMN